MKGPLQQLLQHVWTSLCLETLIQFKKKTDCYYKQREAALFPLQLKEKAKIPQSVIDNVVDGTTVL